MFVQTSTNLKMFKIFVLLFSATIVFANFATKEYEQLRLPDHIEPLSYDLKITPDTDTFTFQGKVTILLRVKTSTNTITLHCRKLNVEESRLYEKGSTTSISKGVNQTNDFCTITSLQQLQPNLKYFLSLEFEGYLNENVAGLHGTSYEINGTQKWFLATYLHKDYAREVFPCFNEPQFKTPFTISIARRTDQKVISNTPCDGIHFHRDKNLVWNSCKKTSPLSTNKIGFVVTESSFTSKTNDKIRIWTRYNSKENVQYVLKQSDKILKQLENFTNIPYNASQLDIVVSPENKPGTTTDNWGLFLFTEADLISNEKTLSELQNNKIITTSIVRQLARHWFGGQVTPLTVDYEWLTEAFTGYMEFLVTNSIEPMWKIDTLFNVQVLQAALWEELTDGQTLSSMKTSKENNDKRELISRFKGASIIRMLEHVISRNSLKSVIHKYLTDSQQLLNGLVTSDDFFAALEYQNDIDSFPLPPHFSITDVMKTWTENFAYPLIYVSRDYQNGTIEIEQSTHAPSQTVTSTKQKWVIPISYTSKSEGSFYSQATSAGWIYTDKIALPVHVESTDWIIFNLQQTVYCRVNYDLKNWDLLTMQLKENKSKIHFLNRAQLIDDAFAFAFKNELPYSVPLKLSYYLQNETETVPMLSAIFHLDMLYTKYEDTPSKKLFQIYIQKILEKQIQHFGFEVKSSDDYHTKIGKISILSLSCKVGISSCVQRALQEYNSNIGDLSRIQPDLKEVVLCTALRETEDPENVYENLLSIYHSSEIAHEKMTILKTFSCIRNENLLKKIVSKLFDKTEYIGRSEEDTVYESILSSSNGITATLRFILERIPHITKMKNDELQTLKKLLHKLEHNVRTREHNKILKTLRTEFNKLDQIYSTFKELFQSVHSLAIERVKDNAKNSAVLKDIFYDTLDIPSIYIPSDDSPSNAATISLSTSFISLYLFYFGFIIYSR